LLPLPLPLFLLPRSKNHQDVRSGNDVVGDWEICLDDDWFVDAEMVTRQ